MPRMPPPVNKNFREAPMLSPCIDLYQIALREAIVAEPNRTEPQMGSHAAWNRSLKDKVNCTNRISAIPIYMYIYVYL